MSAAAAQAVAESLFCVSGEYVAAEKIEAAYKKNGLVEQIWVYGNSLESTLVAIVVPTGEHPSYHAVSTAVSPAAVLLVSPIVLPAVIPLTLLAMVSAVSPV